MGFTSLIAPLTEPMLLIVVSVSNALKERVGVIGFKFIFTQKSGLDLVKKKTKHIKIGLG